MVVGLRRAARSATRLPAKLRPGGLWEVGSEFGTGTGLPADFHWTSLCSYEIENAETTIGLHLASSSFALKWKNRPDRRSPWVQPCTRCPPGELTASQNCRREVQMLAAGWIGRQNPPGRPLLVLRLEPSTWMDGAAVAAPPFSCYPEYSGTQPSMRAFCSSVTPRTF